MLNKSLLNQIPIDNIWFRLLIKFLLIFENQVSERMLFEACPYNKKIWTFTDFINVMAHLGFNSKILDTSIAAVNEKNLPCIFVTQNSEAFIVASIKKNNIYIMRDGDDVPSLCQDLTMTGQIVYFSQFKRKDVQSNWIGSILRARQSLFFSVFLATAVYNIFIMLVPFYLMFIYDRVLPLESVGMLVGLSVGIVGVLAIINLLIFFRAKTLSFIGGRLEKTIGFAVMKTILYLPLMYTESAGVANQIARIKDFDVVRDFFSSQMFVAFLELPVTLCFLFIIYWLGAGLVIIPVFLMIILYIVYCAAAYFMKTSFRNKSLHRVMRQDFLVESLQNIRDIKLANAVQNWLDKDRENSIMIAKYTFKSSLLQVVFNSIYEYFMMLAGVMMVFLGVLFAIDAKITAGGLVAIMLLTWKILQPIKFFFSNIEQFIQIVNSVKQINNLVKIKTEEEISKSNINFLDRMSSRIEFSHVSFRYQAAAFALLNVNFNIEPGELVCITGSAAAGKSTLLKLLLSLYQPQAGNIFINNKNIKQIPAIYLRHNVGYMPQYPKLFNGSLKDNLLLCNPQAKNVDVEVVARLVGIHDSIQGLENNYNTSLSMLSEDFLSAAMKQKIILARTLLTRTNLYLFDDLYAATNLDADDNFLKILQWLKGHNTVILVSSRPLYIMAADKVVKMHEGQIIEINKPEKILYNLNLKDGNASTR